MKSRFKSLAALAFSVLTLSTAAFGPAQTREAQLSTEGGNFPLYVTVEYLGMAGVKTVVRVRLRAPELSMAAAKRGLKSFSGELQGSFLKDENIVQAFKYPVSGALDERTTFTYAFLRAIQPGDYVLRLVLAAPGGKQVGEAKTEISVPEVGNPFTADLAPGESSTLPAAEAIVIADEAGTESIPAGGGSKLKILPPARETPIGILRLEADVEPPITKVEFYLEDKLILSRSRPPYTVEIDLGEVPRKQTIRAVGYDGSGKLIDEDAWAINQGSSRLAVKILPQPDPAAGKVRIKVVVQSIAGGVAKQVELYLNDKRLKAWANDGPYEVTIPMNEYSRGDYLRATAIGDDGKEANDIRMLKGPNTTIESVRVDVVQLHVSAVDKSNRFVPGPLRDRLQGPGGRPSPGDHGLRGRREAPADDRARRRRVGLDGAGDALRPRGLGRALPGPHPREGPGLRDRVPRAAPAHPEPDGRLRGAPARRPRARRPAARRPSTTRSCSASTSSARCRAARPSSS